MILFASHSRPEELSRNYLRVECSIRNYPPISNTLELVQRTLIFNEDTSGIVCPESVTFSGNYILHFNRFQKHQDIMEKNVLASVNIDTDFLCVL